MAVPEARNRDLNRTLIRTLIRDLIRDLVRDLVRDLNVEESSLETRGLWVDYRPYQLDRFLPFLVR